MHVSYSNFQLSTLVGNFLLLPGATMATILMLGFLHARRMYDDKKACVAFVICIHMLIVHQLSSVYRLIIWLETQ